jgi:anaerobic magnesium-protoporphyrin IX monomethyl ester cyclase
MRVLLLNIPFQSGFQKFTQELPPLGIGYLAAMLKEYGHQVHVVDLNVPGQSLPSDLAEFDLVGLSADTPRHNQALSLAAKIKQEKLPVAMGGPHVSFRPEETLRTGQVDYVIRGEGEYPLLYLLEYLQGHRSLQEVPSIAYLQQGELMQNSWQFTVEDVDFLPFPARELLPMQEYKTHLGQKRATSIISSRGCPFNCSFCASSQLFGLKWRPRSPESVVDEVQEVQNRYQVSNILFMDDNFALDPKRTIKICELMQHKDMHANWLCTSRVNTIVENEDMVQSMAEAGARMVFLGIESTDPEVLKNYNKGISPDLAEQALNLLKKYKIKTMASFIIGNMKENKKMIRNTIKFATKLKPELAQFSILTPYPGTQLFNKVKDQIITWNWSLYDGLHATIRTDLVKPDTLEKLLKWAYFSFYLHPRKVLANPGQGIKRIFYVPRLFRVQG